MNDFIAQFLQAHPAPWSKEEKFDGDDIVDANGRPVEIAVTPAFAEFVVNFVNEHTPKPPLRQRVYFVTIGREYANVHRINADDWGFYRLTPASRNRLIDACSRMMDSDGVKHGIAMFSREVPQS
jgi:hypothetical protein